MQRALICFASGSILQVLTAPEVVQREAEKWASNPSVEEVWIVPSTGLRRLVRSFRDDPSFLKAAIRHMDGSYRA